MKRAKGSAGKVVLEKYGPFGLFGIGKLSVHLAPTHIWHVFWGLRNVVGGGGSLKGMFLRFQVPAENWACVAAQHASLRVEPPQFALKGGTAVARLGGLMGLRRRAVWRWEQRVSLSPRGVLTVNSRVHLVGGKEEDVQKLFCLDLEWKTYKETKSIEVDGRRVPFPGLFKHPRQVAIPFFGREWRARPLKGVIFLGNHAWAGWKCQMQFAWEGEEVALEFDFSEFIGG